jgi:hypothetical protein
MGASGTRHGVAGLPWIGWQLSCGLGGRFAMDWVAGFTWIEWQLCHGLGGSFPTDWAAAFSGIVRRVTGG